MLFKILMIIIGFVLLVLGANFLIKGSTNIAKKFHIPEMLIGLTIVALGTSAPELIITITSANKGASDLIIGNAIGSNLCNLLLILGLMAILRPVQIDKEAVKIHIPISLFATLFVLTMGLGMFRKCANGHKHKRWNNFINTIFTIFSISNNYRNKKYSKNI